MRENLNEGEMNEGEMNEGESKTTLQTDRDDVSVTD